MAEAVPAPTKIFRDEAKTGSVQCPSCGGPITLRGFGATAQVSCPYCGSELEPVEGGALDIHEQAQRQRRKSVLDLHLRGSFDGAHWEIIGIIWRACRVDGMEYPWQEFLLFNPYRGYRWLVYSMSDGHWSIGAALDGAPKAGGGTFTHKKVEFAGESYRHFQTVGAYVTYVEGEFPWQVKAGDKATAHEYVKPPTSISIEESVGFAGSDVNFTSMTYIAGRDVWAAFGLPGSPPSTSGVGPIQPNPHRPRNKVLWLSFLGFFAIWVVLVFLYVGGRDEEVLVSENGIPFAPFVQEIEIGTAGTPTTIDFTFQAQPLSNSWAFVDVMLVTPQSEEAVGFGVEVDEYHGVSGGESWAEGKSRRTITVGAVPGGKYLLQVTPQTAPPRGLLPGQADNTAGGMTMSIQLRQDVVLWRYIGLPLIPIFLFPLLNVILLSAFEGRRWQNSDYSTSE